MRESVKEAAKRNTMFPLETDQGSNMYNAFISGADWQKSQNIEYRDLLKKYIEWVCFNGGVSFSDYPLDSLFSKQEIEELKRIEEEI
jgi:hypothetical protein